MIFRKNSHLIPKITFFYLQYSLKSKNETLKQTLMLAIAKTVLIVAVSVPHTANAMPIDMVKTALIQSLSSSMRKHTTDVSNIYNKNI